MPTNPILKPHTSVHLDGDFTQDELQLANRNSGTLLETLRHDITPVGAHYLLTHFDVPYVSDQSEWSLEIQAFDEQHKSWSLQELKGLPKLTKAVTLECAGNGRSLMSPRWPSHPWGLEAVGTAEWGGTLLQNVLGSIDITTESNIVFFGADEGVSSGDRHFYGRSLTLAQIEESGAMLVWEMNGQPLNPQHGYPLRLVVPGWYGMASVKWLNKIVIQTQPFDGHQQVDTYWIRDKDDNPLEAITTIAVRSLMVPPGIPDWSTRKRLIDAGKVTIRGRAWSGAGVPIEKVEFGINGSWSDAALNKPDSAHAWTSWQIEWSAEPGQHELCCRATDANGNVQPLDSVAWNRGGFCNNICQRVEAWCV